MEDENAVLIKERANCAELMKNQETELRQYEEKSTELESQLKAHEAMQDKNSVQMQKGEKERHEVYNEYTQFKQGVEQKMEEWQQYEVKMEEGKKEAQITIGNLGRELQRMEGKNLRLEEQVEKQDGVQHEIERKFIELTTVTDTSIKSKVKHLERKDKLISQMQTKSDKMVQ